MEIKSRCKCTTSIDVRVLGYWQVTMLVIALSYQLVNLFPIFTFCWISSILILVGGAGYFYMYWIKWFRNTLQLVWTNTYLDCFKHLHIQMTQRQTFLKVVFSAFWLKIELNEIAFHGKFFYNACNTTCLIHLKIYFKCINNDARGS